MNSMWHPRKRICGWLDLPFLVWNPVFFRREAFSHDSSCNFIQRFNTLMVAKAFILNKSHWRVSCLVSMDRSICINSFCFLYLSRHLTSSCVCCLRRSRSGTLIIWCGSFRLHNTVWNVICLPWSVFIRLRFVGDRLWGLGCLATAPLFLKVWETVFVSSVRFLNVSGILDLFLWSPFSGL